MPIAKVAASLDAEKKVEAKATEVKAAVAEKKEEVKKVAAPAKKTAAPKKAVAKKAAAPAKKTAVSAEVMLQFAEKEYTQESLLKIAKDVWKYDLKGKASELTEIKLYVKPEESRVYYVLNGKDGSFEI